MANTEESELAEDSPLNNLDESLLERMAQLANNSFSGRNSYKDPIKGEEYSNCLGTALYIHGLTGFDFPTFLDESFSFSELFEKVKKPGSIYSISDPNEPSDFHAGIFIEQRDKVDIVFEQKGFWPNYACFKPEHLKGDEATFGLGSYLFPSSNYTGMLDFYYPIKGKEEEIKSRVRKAMLTSAGMRVEDLRELESLETGNLNSSLMSGFLRRNEQLLVHQAYPLHKVMMELKGKQPYDFAEFAKRSFLAELAMKKGSTTSFAMRHFVTEETDRDFLNSLAA